MVVLDAGEMPDQPPDGVGVRGDPMLELLGRQPAERRPQGLLDLVVGVEQEVATAHARTATRLPTL